MQVEYLYALVYQTLDLIASRRLAVRNLVEWGSYHLPLDVYMYTCIYASIVCICIWVYTGF